MSDTFNRDRSESFQALLDQIAQLEARNTQLEQRITDALRYLERLDWVLPNTPLWIAVRTLQGK